MKTKLPDKPSELLMVAMIDLEAIQNSPQYRLNMGEWHTPTPDGFCEVCFGGSVMAKSLNFGPGVNAHPLLTNDAILDRKLRALDAFRCGDLNLAFSYLHIAMPAFTISEDHQENTAIFGDLMNLSKDHIEEWKLHMQDMIGVLEAEGY
jgi:hypothetical protein